MATTKTTIILPDAQVEEIRALVATGAAASVSAFVKHALGIALADADGWREMLEDALQQTGGPLTRKERAWADTLLSPKETEETLAKGEGGLSGRTFDAGGLIALDRNDRRVIALVARTTERGMRITIPAAALAQAIRNAARQARLRQLMRQAGTDLMVLDGPDAMAVGLLFGTYCDGRYRRCARGITNYRNV